jgi:hypothetical protein
MPAPIACSGLAYPQVVAARFGAHRMGKLPHRSASLDHAIVGVRAFSSDVDTGSRDKMR